MLEILSSGELDGDRTVLQERLTRLEPRVRRRLLAKCAGIGSIGWCDVDDVLAIARERLDLAIVRRRLVIGSDVELVALLWRTAERVFIDIARRESVEKRSEPRISERYRREARYEDDEEVSDALDAFMKRLDRDDRLMLDLLSRGLSHAQIASELGLTLSAYRSRWLRLKARVRSWCWRRVGQSVV